ncbi:ABC transporter substrate-binding protein [Cohnella lupini]|uniref:Putative aldouronate transport system substrate-binding protein n=1 Tax=Cohnella lupini TaxID=1294267 RepID=A0A3D9INF2_9BACL|nr:ABC transporter substrate-binding protein [Cohnella lupini]RED63292.1 putative aldouronate transport system substrate-binding protein [Cohnella lupini]
MFKKRNAVQAGLTVLLASGMLLAGCGSNNSDNASNASNTQNDSGSSSAEATSSSTSNAADLPPYELKIAFWGNDQKDLPEVEEAMNKILKEKINATIKVMPIASSQWGEQSNLMLTSGEKVDLMIASTLFNYPTRAASGVYLPLDELITKYGSGIQAAVTPAQLSAAEVNGQTYAVPTIKDMASYYGIEMRKDMVDKYHIDVTKIKTLDDLTTVFQTIKENEPDVTPLVAKNPGTSPFYAGYLPFDPLGGSIGVLPDYDNGLKVANWYETPQYANELDLMHKWFQADYVLKDAATSKQSGIELVKAGKAFAFLGNMMPDFDSTISRVVGTEMIGVRLTADHATSDTINNSMWAIPNSSKDPDRAMMLMNLLYSDKELFNLLAWGIEGKDYVKKSDNVIDYPQGVDATNVGYNFNLSYLFGNQFLSYTWTTENPDKWQKVDEFNKNATPSKALGFVFDVNNVKTEVAAVSNAVSEYALGLETGMLDPGENLPKFIAKLKAAGADKIVAEKQKQLDEWAKTQQ